MTRIFFGGKCQDDIPFMRKLSDEIHVGVNLVLNQLKYQGFENYFLSQNNPKFSAISYISM